MATMPHMRRREGDELFCPRCTLRWPHNEEPPSTHCVEDRRGTIEVVTPLPETDALKAIDYALSGAAGDLYDTMEFLKAWRKGEGRELEEWPDWKTNA